MIKLNIYYILIVLLTLSYSLIINNKFCINCKYFITDNLNVKYGRCLLFPKEINDYLVTGNKNDLEYYYCSTARDNDLKCGQNATLYRQKRKKNTL